MIETPQFLSISHPNQHGGCCIKRLVEHVAVAGGIDQEHGEVVGIVKGDVRGALHARFAGEVARGDDVGGVARGSYWNLGPESPFVLPFPQAARVTPYWHANIVRPTGRADRRCW